MITTEEILRAHYAPPISRQEFHKDVMQILNTRYSAWREWWEKYSYTLDIICDQEYDHLLHPQYKWTSFQAGRSFTALEAARQFIDVARFAWRQSKAKAK